MRRSAGDEKLLKASNRGACHCLNVGSFYVERTKDGEVFTFGGQEAAGPTKTARHTTTSFLLPSSCSRAALEAHESNTPSRGSYSFPSDLNNGENGAGAGEGGDRGWETSAAMI